MAKKRGSTDPVAESMMEAMQTQWSAIMVYAFRDGGPDVVKQVLEGLQCRLDEVKKDAEEVIVQIEKDILVEQSKHG